MYLVKSVFPEAAAQLTLNPSGFWILDRLASFKDTETCFVVRATGAMTTLPDQLNIDNMKTEQILHE